MAGIAIMSLEPALKHVVVDLKIAGRLRNRNTAIPDQIYRLKSKLKARIFSLYL